jgi:hypothetical protein
VLNHNYIGTEHILLGLIHEGRAAPPKGRDTEFTDHAMSPPSEDGRR